VLDLLTLASTKPPTSILTPEARIALQAIKELQEARHRADYDSAPRANFSHTEAVTLIDQARDGCAAIRKMRRTASGRVLLLLMFIGDQIAPARRAPRVARARVCYTAPATGIADDRSGPARLKSSQTTAAHRENYAPPSR
jgi:hypothetical protein